MRTWKDPELDPDPYLWLMNAQKHADLAAPDPDPKHCIEL
jgi:hypothetical protein